MDRVRVQPDIEGAIERSRSARAAMRRRRQRRFILLACASILLGGGTALSIAGFDPNDAVEAAVGQTQSLADLLSGRSPGNRTAAELTKTKHAKSASADVLPLKTGLLTPEVPNAVKLARILLPKTVAGEDIAPLALLEPVPPPNPEFILNPPGGEDLVPPGGSSTPPGGSITPPGGGIIGTPPGDDTEVHLPKDEPKEIIPVAAVPEPGTWATMLLGFALMGWRLRRRTGNAGCRRLA